jgi:hypothetical protein
MKEPTSQSWYEIFWTRLKGFPRCLAQGAKNPPTVTGPAASALISTGIGCLAMMISHHLVEADATGVIEKLVWSLGSWIPGSHNPSKMWGNIGSYSGKETVLLIAWPVSWVILHSLWKSRDIKAKTIIFWVLALFIAATVMSWHPLFPYLPLT